MGRAWGRAGEREREREREVGLPNLYIILFSQPVPSRHGVHWRERGRERDMGNESYN